MSRDVKYIGMDVHKEATVIAVLNGNGDLVMESIVETKASSLLRLFTVCGSSCCPMLHLWMRLGSGLCGCADLPRTNRCGYVIRKQNVTS
jgi:hypothetical protein